MIVSLRSYLTLLKILITKIFIIAILDQLFMMTLMKRKLLTILWVKLRNNILLFHTITITITSSITIQGRSKMIKSNSMIPVKRSTRILVPL